MTAWIARANSTDTSTIRHSMKGESSGASAGRGGRRITPASGGSKASTRPSVVAVIMLIHRICAGVSGSVSPSASAATTATTSPPLVGSVQASTLRMLS